MPGVAVSQGNIDFDHTLPILFLFTPVTRQGDLSIATSINN